METIQQHWTEIENADRVYSFFGKYPSLHDTEVIEIRLNRELGSDFSCPTLFLTMLLFDSSVARDDPARKNSKLDLAFTGVEVDTITGFNHQNPLSDFHLRKYECPRLNHTRWEIEFGEMGFRVHFTAGSIAVTGLVPFQPEDDFRK